MRSVSHLAITHAETVHTESGKTIDLLLTEDGVGIHVVGELLETGGVSGFKKQLSGGEVPLKYTLPRSKVAHPMKFKIKALMVTPG